MVEPAWEIRQGDVLERLREMPDESVHCVVTSPPYWGLRDYGTAKWEGGDPECVHKGMYERTGGYGSPKQATNQGANFVASGDCACGAIRIDDQLGLESTPEAYVAKMVAVFREVRRVLRSDGTCWLNLGDSYSGSNGNGNRPQTRVGLTAENFTSFQNVTGQIDGLKPKDLVGIPWMVAFALRSDGWYLRSDIIWSKPNPMPESVTDRPTKSHEYVFLLSKSGKYFFDQEAVRVPLARVWNDSNGGSWAHTDQQPTGSKAGHHSGAYPKPNQSGANVRSVWNIATQPFSEAHFATFPERLVDRCISAGSSEKGVCGECGKPWARKTERVEGVTHQREPAHAPNGYPTKVDSTEWQPMARATDQWQQQCEHDAPPIPATVLDIFSGSGTSGVVARKLARNYIGIELNQQYVAMSERRLRGTIFQAGLFSE